MSIFDRINEWFDDLRVPEDIRRELDDAERLLREGNLSAAFTQLRALDVRYPDVWRTQFLLGLTRETEGALEEACGHYKEALNLRADSMSRLALARVVADLGRHDEARELLVRAADDARRKSDEFEALQRLGELDELDGHWEDAARTWARLRSREPANSTWRLNEALARDKTGSSDIAIDLLRNAPTLDTAIRLKLASMLLNAGAQTANIDEINELLEDVPATDRDWMWQLARAGSYALNGTHEESLKLLFAAAKEAPAAKLGEIHTEIASQFLALENSTRALDHAEAAIMIAPGLKPRLIAARAAIAVNSIEIAQDHARKILAEHPDNEQTRILMARAHVSLGQDQEARALLAPLRRTGSDPEVLIVQAELALRTGDALEAVSLLHEANVRGAASNAAALLHRALKALAPPLPRIARDGAPDAIALSNTLRFLAELATQHFLLAPMVSSINEVRTSLDQPLSIAVLGEFNAGKSTLINAWLGEQVLATGVLPTTSHINRIGYGPRKAARIDYVDGDAEEISFERAGQLVKEEPGRIANLEFGYPHPVLRSVNFWDTPGFNAPDDAHERRAEDALTSADAILWVLDARQALTQSEFSRIATIPDASEKLIVVINKADQYETADLAEIHEHVSTAVGQDAAGIFIISALEAMKAHSEERTEPEAFSGLRTAIDTTFFQRTSELKSLETYRRLRELIAQLLEIAHAATLELEHRTNTLVDARTTRLARWQQEAFELPRSMTHQLGTEVRALRSEIVDSLQSADSGVRILGTVLGSSLNRRAVDDLRVSLRASLKRILERTTATLTEAIGKLEEDGINTVEQIGDDISSAQARTLRRRVEAYLVARDGHRRLLREQLVERTLVAFDARFETSGIPTLLRLVGRDREDAEVERETALLLPLRTAEWQHVVESWVEESLAAHAKLLEQIERDIEILRVDIEHRIVRPIDSVYDALGMTEPGAAALR